MLASRTWTVVTIATAAGLITGCHRIENQFVQDGPSSDVTLDSATVQDLRNRGTAPEHQRERNWEKNRFALHSGAVHHGPLYFQDPFEDKGTGHQNSAGEPEYRMGWEDLVAAPYGFSRFTLNWLLSPVSMVVNPPWQTTESDGQLSKQLLGYDHDPEPVASTADANTKEAPHSDVPPDDTSQVDTAEKSGQ